MKYAVNPPRFFGLLLLAQWFPISPLHAQDSPRPLTLSETIDTHLKELPGYSAPKDSRRVTDEEFLARVMKDIVGAEPTVKERKAFSENQDPKKRERKIDELLGDDRYATFWAGRFEEVFFGDKAKLRMAQIPNLAPGTEQGILRRFTSWFGEQLKKDRPYRDIVFDVLNALGTTEETPALAYKLSFYEKGEFPIEFAKGLSRHFMGNRIRCAECHDHPSDQWRVGTVHRLGAWAVRHRATAFGERNERVRLEQLAKGELQIPDSPQVRTTNLKLEFRKAGEAFPMFLYGGYSGNIANRNRVLANLATVEGNTQLPRALVNRVWGWLLGDGLVRPVDDFNVRKKPRGNPLLEAMTRDFIENEYSLKRLIRGICNSDLYQLSEPKDPPPGERWFFRGTVRERSRKVTPLEVTVDVPAGWRREYTYAHSKLNWPYLLSGGSLHYSVPGKGGKAGHAQFEGQRGSGQGDRERWMRQLEKGKETKQKLTDTTALFDLSGHFPCDPRLEGAAAYRVLTGEVQLGEVLWYFRLSGPAETVESWRGEFIALLKSVR